MSTGERIATQQWRTGRISRQVLVTGAGGVVGPCLCAMLEARGLCFATLGRGRAPVAGEFIKADLSRPAGIEFENHYDVLIHMAPLWLLPDNLGRMAAAGVRRVVAFSSTSAESKQGSADPADRALAGSLLAAEERLQREAGTSGIAVTLFRPTMIYGYGRDANVMAIARLIRRLGFFPVAGPGKGCRQPVHAADLAWSALACVGNEATAGRTYHLGGGETMSYTQMVTRIFTAMERTARVMHIPEQIYRALMTLAAKVGMTGGTSPGAAARMNQDLCFDTGPASSDFGFRGSAFLEHPQRDLPL